MTPQLKTQNGKLIIDGNFEFEFGKPLYNPSTYTPTIDITFKWGSRSFNGNTVTHER